MWAGGRIHNRQYIMIRLHSDSPFYPMVITTNNSYGGYVLEHRLVMAGSLNRCLKPWEIVHHKNGIKDDNRLENLQLVSDDEHKQITLLEKHIEKLELIIAKLEIENKSLLENHAI